MPFEPTGNVYVGTVPWTDDLSHVRWYTSTVAQYNDIRDLCTVVVPSDTYTYIRWNSSLKVLCNAETLKRYNYVMFRNTNSPNGVWVYAFIAECNYISVVSTKFSDE